MRAAAEVVIHQTNVKKPLQTLSGAITGCGSVIG